MKVTIENEMEHLRPVTHLLILQELKLFMVRMGINLEASKWEIPLSKAANIEGRTKIHFQFNDAGMAGYLSPILVTLLVGLEDLVPSDFPEFNVKLFWNRDLFDDSFFTQPIGSSSFGSSTGFSFQLGIHPSGFLQHLVLGMHPSGFIRHQFPRVHPSGFLDHQAPEPRRHRGPIIQGLDSDYETEYTTEERKENPRKRSRSNDEPSVEHPDDETEGKKSRQLYSGNEYNSHYSWPRPQSQSFYFQSSTVSYGCVNGIIPPQGQEGVRVLE